MAPSSDTWAAKTEFAQEKWLKRKQKKYVQMLRIIKSCPMTICEVYVAKNRVRKIGRKNREQRQLTMYYCQTTRCFVLVLYIIDSLSKPSMIFLYSLICLSIVFVSTYAAHISFLADNYQDKVCGLRWDTLAQILSGLYAGSRVLIFDSVLGLVVGSAAYRMRGMGRIMAAFAGQQPHFSILDFLNLKPSDLDIITVCTPSSSLSSSSSSSSSSSLS